MIKDFHFKVIFVILFVLFFSLKNESALFASDFSQACNVLKAENITSGNFVSKKYISASSRTLKAYGIFTVCTGGIIWETQKPVKNTLCITSSKITQIDPKGNRVELSSADNQIFALISKMMATLFSGNQDELEEYFTVEFTQNADDSWIMKLFPKDSTISGVMEQIELCGNQTVMSSMKTIQKNHDYLLYEFENQTLHNELTEEQKSLLGINEK